MIILRNKGHGEIFRVCMGLFTTSIRNKNISQIFNKNTSPTSTACSLLSDRLLSWKEPISLSYPFLGFYSQEMPKGAHSISERPIREANNPGSKQLGGQKFNLESERI